MAADEIRFYLDEHLSPRIIKQLQRVGIDAIRGPIGDSDLEHLYRARDLGRVLCTADRHFVQLHESGIEHAGIIKAHSSKHHVGTWIRYLKAVHAICSVADMTNTIEYVFETD